MVSNKKTTIINDNKHWIFWCKISTLLIKTDYFLMMNIMTSILVGNHSYNNVLDIMRKKSKNIGLKS